MLFLVLNIFFVLLPLKLRSYTNSNGIMASGGPVAGSSFYYYEIFTKINGGPPVYLTGIQSQCSRVSDYFFQHFTTYGKTCEFQVTAFDSHDLQGIPSEWSEPFSSNVNSGNFSMITALFADAGNDKIISMSSINVVLDGNMSYDLFYNDISSLNFFWECFAWPRDATATLSDPNIASPIFTPSKVGTYYFRLYVSSIISESNFNNSSVNYMKVIVVDDLNDFVVANTGAATRVPIGAIAVLDGSDSQSTSEILVYKWEAINNGVTIINSDQPVATFNAEEEGTYTFLLTVMTENDFSSRVGIVSIYDENKVGSLMFQIIDSECIEYTHADFNNDGNIDGQDLTIFASCINSGRGLENYRSDCDFDRNLRIEKFDTNVFAACFGKGE